MHAASMVKAKGSRIALRAITSSMAAARSAHAYGGYAQTWWRTRGERKCDIEVFRIVKLRYKADTSFLCMQLNAS